MSQKTLGKQIAFIAKNRTVLILSGLIGVVIVAALFFIFLKPERSIASYCKIYKEEDAKLAKARGDTYGVAVFPKHSSSNATDFVNAFTRLEQAAPDDIQPDVKTLKQIFQKVENDTSQLLTASMSGLGAEESVTKWTKSHCE